MKKNKKPKKVWEPFQSAVLPEYSVEELMLKFSLTEGDAKKCKERMEKEKVFLNNFYQVNIVYDHPDLRSMDPSMEGMRKGKYGRFQSLWLELIQLNQRMI